MNSFDDILLLGLPTEMNLIATDHVDRAELVARSPQMRITANGCKRCSDTFGMKKKKKKVSDFLIDKKIPLSEKENVWVIESGKKFAALRVRGLMSDLRSQLPQRKFL